MGNKLSSSIIVNCRCCGESVPAAAKTCYSCGIKAPGIRSECPSCGSLNYVYHKYGLSVSRAIGGALLLGPLGLVAGVIGKGDIECICLDCKQGWMPYSRVKGKPSQTRKYKVIPSDCV